MPKIIQKSLAIAICLCAVTLMGVARSSDAQKPTITVKHDADQFQTRVRVAAREGRFYWADVLRGLARAKGWEDEELVGLLPKGSIKANGVSTLAAIMALDRAAKPNIRFRRLKTDGAAEPTLEITLDRAAILASRRRFKKIARRMLTPRRSQQEYGLRLPKNWKKLPRDSTLVVVVHGWNSEGERFDPLLRQLKDSGHTTAVFDYPNDQPVADSAERFSQELRNVAKERPDLRLAIVGHSMGGLVAREAIENPKLDPGNVERLIMVATPNHGSELARIAFAVDFWQFASDLKDKSTLRSFFSSIEDGLAEATHDLRPDSVFLTTLNGRERNKKVRYSLILGDKGLLTAIQWAAARRSVASSTRRHRFSRIFGPKLDGILANMDEVIRGRGDGAVSVRRGKLTGVDDVVVLPFLHTDLAANAERAKESGLFDAITERLK